MKFLDGIDEDGWWREVYVARELSIDEQRRIIGTCLTIEGRTCVVRHYFVRRGRGPAVRIQRCDDVIVHVDTMSGGARVVQVREPLTDQMVLDCILDAVNSLAPPPP